MFYLIIFSKWQIGALSRPVDHSYHLARTPSSDWHIGMGYQERDLRYLVKL